MTEEDKNTKEREAKISKLAVLSLAVPLMSLLFGIIVNVEFIRLILVISPAVTGILLGVPALILIKKSKGTLRGKWFAISGIIISLIFIALFVLIVYSYYKAVFYEKPYNDSNSLAIMANVEKTCDFTFPEKTELKTAEKIASGIDRPYTFIARFNIDRNSFAKFRNSFSDFEEITNKLATEGGKSLTYSTITMDFGGGMWLKNAPEWFNEKIPDGKAYELSQFNGGAHIQFICFELPDSNDVIVNMIGSSNNRKSKK